MRMIDPLVPGAWILRTQTADYELTIDSEVTRVRVLPSGAPQVVEHVGGAHALHRGDRVLRVGDRLVLSLRLANSDDWTAAHLTAPIVAIEPQAPDACS